MRKRIFFIVVTLLLAVFITACSGKEYTVTYDIDGVTNAVKVKEDRVLEIPEDPVKEGYNFDFWLHVEKDVKWNFANKVESNMTLKATFKEIEKDVFTVTFVTLGGTPQIDPVEVIDGEKVDEPDVTLTREGYEFLGWYLNDELFDFEETPITENIFITARWKVVVVIEYVTVTFNTDGGNQIEPVEIEKYEKVTIPAEPTKEGYDFVGWYIGDVKYNFDSPVLEDITLTARWEEEVIVYNVTFDLGFDSDYEFDQVLNPGEKATMPEEPERFGFNFLGWYVGEEVYDFDLDVTEDITITAKWQEVHAITFDTVKDSDYVIANPIILDGELLPEPEEDPYVEFFVFLGWYLDDELYDFDTPVTRSFTLEARWEEEPYVARAFIGEQDFRSVALALDAATTGDIILIAGGVHRNELTINVDDLTLKSVEGQTATIANVINLAVNLNGVKFENLEFTGDASIHAPGKIDNFEFINNIVYDSTLKADNYLPNNRIDVNAFIRLYTLAGENIVGNVTIKGNRFSDIEADVISLARSSVGKEFIIEDNEFINISKTAIRFDGGYNNGTYLIKNNLFENDPSLPNVNAILFRAYSSSGTNVQIIDIIGNEFYHMGDNSMPLEEGATHPGSSAIAFSTYNEGETHVTIKDNIFDNTENTIHLRNVKGNHQKLNVKITHNTFIDTKGFYLYEAAYEPDRDDTDFNFNKFIVDGVIVTDVDDIKDRIINNQNYDNIVTE